MEGFLKSTLETIQQQASALEDEYHKTADTDADELGHMKKAIDDAAAMLTPTQKNTKLDPTTDATPPPTMRASHHMREHNTSSFSTPSSSSNNKAHANESAQAATADQSVRAETAERRAKVEAARATEAEQREALAQKKIVEMTRAFEELREGSTSNDEVAEILARARTEHNAEIERLRAEMQEEAENIRSQLGSNSIAMNIGEVDGAVIASSHRVVSPIVVGVESPSPTQAASLSAALADADHQLSCAMSEMNSQENRAAADLNTLTIEMDHMRTEMERLKELLAEQEISSEAAARGEMAAHAAAADSAADAEMAREAAAHAEEQCAKAIEEMSSITRERDQLFDEATKLQRDVASLREEAKLLRRRVMEANEAVTHAERNAAAVVDTGSAAGAAAVRAALSGDADPKGLSAEKFRYLRQTTLDYLLSDDLAVDAAWEPIATVLELSPEEKVRISNVRRAHAPCSLSSFAAGISDPTELARTHPRLHTMLMSLFSSTASALHYVIDVARGSTSRASTPSANATIEGV